ncbi:MAG: right-handed parallel beta-helix repeat-containing protein [Bacteroidota bacterium]
MNLLTLLGTTQQKANSNSALKLVSLVSDNGDNTFTITTKLNTDALLYGTPFVAAMGSSTMNGEGPTVTANQLRNRIDAWLAANTTSYRWFETATSTYTTNKGRPDYTDDPAIQHHRNIDAVASTGVDIILLWFTSNDQADGVNTPETYVDHIVEMIDEGNRKGAFVFVATPGPRTSFNATERQRLIDSRDLLFSDPRIDNSLIIDILEPLSINVDPGDDTNKAVINPSFDADGVHTNDAGHQVQFDLLIEALENYFIPNPGYEAIELERSTNPITGFTVIDADAGLSKTYTRPDGVRYYYRTRVRYATGVYGDYSNVFDFQQSLNSTSIEQVVKINFSPSPAIEATYNNFALGTPTSGQTLSNLLDETGTATGISIEVLNDWFGSGTNGVNDNSVFPLNVIQNNWRFLGDQDAETQLRITGLSDGNNYTIKLVASVLNAQPDRWCAIQYGDRYTGVNAGANNGSELATIHGCVPVGGEITIDLKAPWYENGYVAGLIIERVGVAHVLSLAENQSHDIDFAANYPEIMPGDTVIIPAGTYNRLYFRNFVGDENNKLTLINGSGGRVNVTGQNAALGFYDANHIRVTGSGSSDQYGFQLHPTTAVAAASVGIGGYASGLEFERCEIYDCGFAGFFLKLDFNAGDSSTWRANYEMTGLDIHDCWVHDVGGEGMYLGTTIPGDGTNKPHLITNARIYNNLIENTGWDGIQLSRCTDHQVYGNTIINYATENQAGQNTGISIANESTGRVHNNRIDTGTGDGITCFGGADNVLYNNIIIDPGRDGFFINDNSIDVDYPGYDSGATIRPGYTIAANTIIRPVDNGIQINGTAINNKRVYNNIVASAGGSNIFKTNGSLVIDEQGNTYDTVANLLFVDEANDDYNLAAGSPAIDAGIDISSYGITEDYAGTSTPIGANYDSGAYEAVASTPSSVTLVPINTESNGSSNNPRGYIRYEPIDYNTRNDWPLIIWLHGIGEAGDGDSDLAGLLDHAMINYLNTGNDISYLALAPQSFNGYFGANRLHDFIEWALVKYGNKINLDKVHVACVSGSGAGIDNLALNYPATLAKLDTVTIGAGLTGNGGTTQYNNFVAGNVRTWWHHGDGDLTVGYGATLNYYEGIVQAFGGQDFDNHRYTRYAGLGHSAWQETYDNSGRDKPQVTGQISALVGDYFFWQAPDTWYEFLEGTAPPPAAPSNLQLDNTSINEETTGVVGNLTVQGSPTPVLSITLNDNLFSLTGNNELNLDVAQDYETMGAVKQVQVEVTATNSEGSISQTFDIDINDITEGAAPTIVFLSVTNIDENNSINDIIGLLTADGDGNKTFAISGTDQGSFNTNVDEFRASEVYDFETKSSYSIFITATNSFGSSPPTPFTININDVPEGGGDELIGTFNLGRASRPQVDELLYPDIINVNENTPAAADPAINAFGLTFHVTEDFSSTPNVTYEVPSDLQGFPIEVWQNGWYDRFNGRIDVDDYNDSDLYKFRIPVNIDRTTDTSIEIKINGVVVYSNLVHPQGPTATVVEVANVAPVAGKIYYEIGGEGAAPIGERYGGVCAIQIFRQL